jgi:5S rRNA maturation endonuclease (ribonuclease M5)
MADSMGREVFKAGGWPSWNSNPPRFVVVEGEPDFLTMACKVPLNRKPSYAVVGIYAGSWSSDVAGVIPSGSKVAVWTDADAAGDKYAAKIRESIEARCEVQRKRVAA